MSNIFIIYPHQLFKNIEPLKNKKVLLVEEPLFLTQYRFHIQKVILHRASMKFYEEYLSDNGIEVEYFENEDYLITYKNCMISIYDVVDDWLLKKIKNNFKHLKIFLNPNFFNVHDTSKFLYKYYINRRLELNLFIQDGMPQGGKWSFDSDNRKKLPKSEILPKVQEYENIYIDEARTYCKRFVTNAECTKFFYPVTFEEAEENFEYFLRYKFEKFGFYQDAIVQNESFLYHSNISASLNIGLLDLQTILKKTISYEVPFNSKEGFIRQIIGWREFMLSIYKSNHITMRNSNYFQLENKIPPKLINGNSGVLPLDDVIKKLNKTAYNHHIERLMIIGNIFLLLEINPNEVYRFFMANYIDAYDWVMVANVYGMSQFSDGGTITTKPYISSSNYILKMSSDYKKTDEWCRIWDALYWRFLDKYKNIFQSNPRMIMQVSLLDKMEKVKLQAYKDRAEEFIKEIKC